MKNLILLFCLIGLVSFTQTQQPAKDDANANPDQDFVMKAANGGMMEVELGTYASTNAQSQRVKNFAAMMVRDHSKANAELKAVASKESITVPASMNKMHQSHVDMMKKKSGADFDKAYMGMMVNDHKKDVNEFKEAEGKVKNQSLKDFIRKTLPVLQTHLDSAQAINASLK